MKHKIDTEYDWKETLYELKNVILLILTVIDLIFIFLSTVYSFNFTIDNYFADYDFIVCVLLFIDLAFDFYFSEQSFKEYFITEKQILSILSLLPFDLLFRYFAIFRLFRFLKIIKIVRIWHVTKDIDSLYYFIENHMLKMLFIILMIYIFLSSYLFIILDNSIDNLPEAFWFIIVTISTVGYGDITPVSPIGKSLAVLTIVIGTIVIAIFTAYLSAMYNERPAQKIRDTFNKHSKKIEKIVKNIQTDVNELDEKIMKLEEENKQLKNKLDEMNEKLDKITEKL